MHGRCQLGSGDCPPESWMRDPLRNLEREDLGDPRRSVQSPLRGPPMPQRVCRNAKHRTSKAKTPNPIMPRYEATAVCGGTTSAALEEFLARLQAKP
jgi:hypothetical protein